MKGDRNRARILNAVFQTVEQVRIFKCLDTIFQALGTWTAQQVCYRKGFTLHKYLDFPPPTHTQTLMVTILYHQVL